jgi:uncharacterized membrane protein YagU involved in acid resistance
MIDRSLRASEPMRGESKATWESSSTHPVARPGGDFQRAAVAILPIGLIAGTLDIAENLIFNAFRRITPKMVFEFIASGLVGPKSAAQLGAAVLVLGVAIHYFIAISWTAVFYAMSRKMAWLRQRPVPSGLLYGAFVYLFMNFLVLPLTRIPHPRAAATLASRVNGVLALLFCIGLTISLLVARFDRRMRAQSS